MKKIAGIIFFSCLISCDSKENKKGFELISKSDCATCHKEKEVSVGPAYESIADKYAATAEVQVTLSQNIIKGSKGKWGSVPMTAHPQLSKEDAETMAEYILSLKK